MKKDAGRRSDERERIAPAPRESSDGADPGSRPRARAGGPTNPVAEARERERIHAQDEAWRSRPEREDDPER